MIRLAILSTSLLLSACAGESCTKLDGAGFYIRIGCDEVTMQPVTRSETLERHRTQNSGE